MCHCEQVIKDDLGKLEHSVLHTTLLQSTFVFVHHHGYSFTVISIRSPSLYLFTINCIRSPPFVFVHHHCICSPSFVFVHYHLYSFTVICIRSPSFVFIRSHLYSFTIISHKAIHSKKVRCWDVTKEKSNRP